MRLRAWFAPLRRSAERAGGSSEFDPGAGTVTWGVRVVSRDGVRGVVVTDFDDGEYAVDPYGLDPERTEIFTAKRRDLRPDAERAGE